MSPLADCVLVVDDEWLICELWCAYLDAMGVDVCGTAATADAAVGLATEHRPSVVLMDVRLRGEKDGVDAALAIHEFVGSKVIFITGSKEQETIARINMDHPSAVLFKPVSGKQLTTAITQAMAR